MNILTHLQELDNLIVERTKPPVTAVLRNKLSLAVEQAEAHSSAVERQEQTLARQIEAMAQLQKENQHLVAENQKLVSAIAEQQSQPRRIIPEGGYGDDTGLL